MKNLKKYIAFALVGALLLNLACGDSGGDDGPDTTDSFDREAMLAHWADNIIIPAYERYFETLQDLQTRKDALLTEANMDNLTSLRRDFRIAYGVWQTVSMFEIGPAETVTLRNFTNIFPANAQEIEENVMSGSANLELPSNNDSQGFPALDYLLYGVADDDASILAKLSETSYQNYLSAIVERLYSLGSGVRNAWRNEGYRDTFVSASGSTATSSVNRMANDFMFYYEKSLRAGKVGIPAGVFNGNPLSDRAEAPFSGVLSKELLLNALAATQGFFRGEYQGGASTGPSFDQYLDDLDVRKDDRLLSDLINTQLVSAQSAIENLNDDLKTQVEMDNSLMLRAYDELQKVVVLLKVDMFQALNIQVDFVDADGD